MPAGLTVDVKPTEASMVTAQPSHDQLGAAISWTGPNRLLEIRHLEAIVAPNLFLSPGGALKTNPGRMWD